ncbi:DUF2947 family protein [Thalassotalea sp. HSM 43]|uniref:DUF2947 family protein n=1 Tax=Thalassotalea sp. HSM 43 TaxID=2552945 RepID=UPI001081D5E8|nr:DUF2947 family protein [Thalassotalea sp. HSM 43]QBY03511.1 DUF2947 family protein [Thalassotalea sp. HSM 43]
MNYIKIDDLKYAWVFRFKQLPISEQDMQLIKPMAPARCATLWGQFIAKNADHPDFIGEADWPGKDDSWHDKGNWQNAWESDDESLPDEIADFLDWQGNTTVYFCNSRKQVIETRFDVFQRCWKNFLMMDDGPILIAKKKKQAIQFFPDGTFRLGTMP